MSHGDGLKFSGWGFASMVEGWVVEMGGGILLFKGVGVKVRWWLSCWKLQYEDERSGVVVYVAICEEKVSEVCEMEGR